MLFSVTDISELEQRIRDLPLHSDKADDEDIISVASEGSSEPSDYRPWENHADRALLPSCMFINKMYRYISNKTSYWFNLLSHTQTGKLGRQLLSDHNVSGNKRFSSFFANRPVKFINLRAVSILGGQVG